jgi:hypothetical protein
MLSEADPLAQGSLPYHGLDVGGTVFHFLCHRRKGRLD